MATSTGITSAGIVTHIPRADTAISTIAAGTAAVINIAEDGIATITVGGGTFTLGGSIPSRGSIITIGMLNGV